MSVSPWEEVTTAPQPCSALFDLSEHNKTIEYIALQGIRALRQVEEVTEVESAEALQGAVVAAMPHIVIRAHLDLTILETTGGRIFGTLPDTIKSIRVRFLFPCPVGCPLPA